MTVSIQLPRQSELDTKLSNDGSIDPLALYPISENLATLLCPGVRERMKNPRFLTLMAVSYAVCSDFEDGAVANDDIASPPWQVFEWYVVEGLVRSMQESEDLAGLPGRDKAVRTVEMDLGLSAKRYLKVASVFGFHGVYRPLAKALGIDIAGRLGEFGRELLDVWQSDNELPGFLGGSQGAGAKFRERLKGAVADGLERGEVAHKKNWREWEHFRTYLSHKKMSPREARLICDRLIATDTTYMKPVLEFLMSPTGQDIAAKDYPSERFFHESLIRSAGTELTHLLDAIMSYEVFSRLLQNAFDESLRTLCDARRGVKFKEISCLRAVEDGATRIPTAFKVAAEKIAQFNLPIANRFCETFRGFETSMSPLDWSRFLFEHHTDVQKRKPPHGKFPWALCDTSKDTLHIQTNYIRDYAPRFDGAYVSFYRMNSLQSFLRCMGLANRG